MRDYGLTTVNVGMGVNVGGWIDSHPRVSLH